MEDAISSIGKGISFDGLPGKILKLIPENLRECILLLFQIIYSNTYPVQWRTQLLFPIEKKGHLISNPKLRGIAVGPLLSRLFDMFVNRRFSDWYIPNSEQAGFRKQQGCIVQLFALFLTIQMAKSLNKSLFIGLLDFAKAFDFMNRPMLMKDLMKKGIGCGFLKNLFNIYEEVNYSPKTSYNMMGQPISADHGVTQGRNSSCNIFSFYISDMSEPLKNLNNHEFTEPENILQLADDTIILAENEDSLTLKFQKILEYTQSKYIIVNMDKTKYMQLAENPSFNELHLKNESIKAVNPQEGYTYLGFSLSYTSEVTKLVEYNFTKKKMNIGKFYAWLQINHNTPFPLKMKILYNCMFPALLYSSEIWGDLRCLENELLLIERKALKACLGIKQGTSDGILYIEINKPDIIASIYRNQYNFYQRFVSLDPMDSSARRIWQKYMDIDDIDKPYLEHYETLESHQLSNNIQNKKQGIRDSDKSMDIRYRDLFGLEYNDTLYNSMVDDSYRTIITRWRLSSHKLFVETGRYKKPYIPRDQRTCIICNLVEDETHALFLCKAHNMIRVNYRDLLNDYTTIGKILNPTIVSDITRIAKYIREIERNMEKLKMIR